jgi:succinate dehydrogenase hydrophobic anchor subunit
MWQNIVNIGQTVSAFLINGKAPPNTPEYLEKQMEDTNHLASKKFFVIFSAIIMIVVMFLMAVGFLFIIPADHDIVVTAYSTIFTKIIEIFGLVISVYIGAQGLVDLRYNSSSSASIEGEAQSETSISEENKNVNLNENILTNNAKEDDYNISEVEV